ncbi:MGMT family protein [Acidothermaceae bacterium B102]|nr:MGMT family protein [Acidothermaceae bacterium B102]
MSDTTEAVLAMIERIPEGKVASYGDIAEMVGLRSGRIVGQVLSREGGGVPWHRVVMASGAPAPHQYQHQLDLLVDEGVPLNKAGTRVDMTRARWEPEDLD